MGGASSEPTETIVIKEPVPIPDHKLVEKAEKDPVIRSRPKDVLLRYGRTYPFKLAYQADHEVVIAFMAMNGDETPFNESPFNGSPMISIRPRNAFFSFDIVQANPSAHNGTYTVKIWDPSLPARTGANPAEASWTVQVD